jgi:hypothetical protein
LNVFPKILRVVRLEVQIKHTYEWISFIHELSTGVYNVSNS